MSSFLGTPINISRLVKVNKPIVRVMYELEEIGKPTLKDVIHGENEVVTCL